MSAINTLFQRGDKIAEGKTKVIYKCTNNDDYVIIVSKDDITAGDGAKRDLLTGKSLFSNTTACNVFRYLKLAPTTANTINTHFVSQHGDDSFVALKCGMIPLEVIVRRLSTGSYVRRFPAITEGTRFDKPVVEFTFKDDANHDPLMTDDEIINNLKLVINGVTVTYELLNEIKRQATLAFEALEKAWAVMDVVLVDFKVEFGLSEGKLLLADVVDNDSWRVWPKGDKRLMVDKQVYRNLPGSDQMNAEGKVEALSKIIKNYEWVAAATSRFVDAIFVGRIQAESTSQPLVGVIMGSQSDWETMKHTATTLEQLGIAFESRIVSAHRTPDRLVEYAKTAKERGLKVIIAGAGGAAHLPGMAAAMTPLPVLGVPVQSRMLSGVDSLLSIVQMPGGIPVGTLAIGQAGATNAALLAASILATSGNYPTIAMKLDEYRLKQTESVALSPSDTPAVAAVAAVSAASTSGKH